MKAWHKDGTPDEHPEPWGMSGVFTTIRIFKGKKIPFFESYLHRLLESASRLQMPWIPSSCHFESKVSEFIEEMNFEHGLLRICLFENLIGFSSRPAVSDGNPVKGWLLKHRRENPLIKSTIEKNLYGALGKLKVKEEDWIIVDPKDNDLRETATSNLIFARQKTLIIPDKYVLNGIVLQNLLPFLRNRYSVIHALPKDREISSFDEIILCGTGRGVAPLTSLTELGWSSGGNEIFSTIRNHYEEIIKSASA